MELKIVMCLALFTSCVLSSTTDSSGSDVQKHEKMVPKRLKELEDKFNQFIQEEREKCMIRENRWIQMLKDAEVYHEPQPTQGGQLAIASTAMSVEYNGEDISGRAVDGDVNKHWGGLSCSHVPQTTGWWQAGLQVHSRVTNVTLHNRGDCCYDRMANFKVEGFERDPAVHPNEQAKLCTNFLSAVGQGGVKTIDCDSPIEANFLRITNNAGSSRNGLTICEFIALGTPTFHTRVKDLSPLQSSYYSYMTFEAHSAWRALDDDPSTCSHTMLGDVSDAWWQVDLQESKTLLSLDITNRDDEKYIWLHEIEVIIYEQHPTECNGTEVVQHTCATHDGVIGQGETKTLTCNPPVTGRYVRIVKKKNSAEALSLCHVDLNIE